MDKELTAAERRALRAKAHTLHPVVLIGDKGLSEAVLHEIEVSLKSHELIKVRAQGEREERDAISAQICERLSAQCVQHIGKVLVIYRQRPPEPSESDPAAGPRAARARRAPGRSVQAGSARVPAARKGQSKRAADRARKRVSAERAPATKPARRRARTR